VDIQQTVGEQYFLLAEADLVRIQADATALGIDFTTASSVPEPGTLTLFGSFFLLWLGLVWRRHCSPYVHLTDRFEAV
jgi:hypothetical protein